MATSGQRATSGAQARSGGALGAKCAEASRPGASLLTAGLACRRRVTPIGLRFPSPGRRAKCALCKTVNRCGAPDTQASAALHRLWTPAFPAAPAPPHGHQARCSHHAPPVQSMATRQCALASGASLHPRAQSARRGRGRFCRSWGKAKVKRACTLKKIGPGERACAGHTPAAGGDRLQTRPSRMQCQHARQNSGNWEPEKWIKKRDTA